MLIKIAKNGIESEWFQLTKKHHRTLLLEKPDVVFVHIDSLYPKSPESGQIVAERRSDPPKVRSHIPMDRYCHLRELRFRIQTEKVPGVCRLLDL